MRVLFYLIAVVLILGAARALVGVLRKGLGELFSNSDSNRGPSPQAPPRADQVQLGGELKKDPVCGTFISTATSIKKSVGGQTLHFCSKECAEKYRAA
jgi:YHS domain-containing protein